MGGWVVAVGMGRDAQWWGWSPCSCLGCGSWPAEGDNWLCLTGQQRGGLWGGIPISDRWAILFWYYPHVIWRVMVAVHEMNVSRVRSASPSSGHLGHSAQPLYNITIFTMHIHLHHSDIHPDQVSYFMGEFILTVIFNQPGFCMVNSARLLVFICHDRDIPPSLVHP